MMDFIGGWSVYGASCVTFSIIALIVLKVCDKSLVPDDGWAVFFYIVACAIWPITLLVLSVVVGCFFIVAGISIGTDHVANKIRLAMGKDVK